MASISTNDGSTKRTINHNIHFTTCTPSTTPQTLIFQRPRTRRAETAHSRGRDCALAGLRPRTRGAETAHSRGRDCALVFYARGVRFNSLRPHPFLFYGMMFILHRVRGNHNLQFKIKKESIPLCGSTLCCMQKKITSL